MTTARGVLGVVLSLALAGGAAASGPCRWPDAMPTAPVVLLGETHGTREAPALAGMLVCAAAVGATPVTLALEMDPGEQPRIDAYLASAGSAADRRALLAGPFWTRRMQDGRSSAAMVALIEQLRGLRSEGLRVAVAAVDSVRYEVRDADMAAHLRRLAQTDGGRMIALLGNRHASQHQGVQDDPGYTPAGHLLADLTPLSVRVEAPRGSAWVCTPGCGVRGFGGRTPPGPAPPTGYRTDAARPGYDGVYTVTAFTASLPALPVSEK